MVKKTAVRELGIAWNKRELELQRRVDDLMTGMRERGTLYQDVYTALSELLA